MNIDSVTTNAALLLGLAIVLLIVAGWRKPARASAGLRRAGRSAFPDARGGLHAGSPVAGDADGDDGSTLVAGSAVQAVDAGTAYRSPSIIRRAGALLGTVGIAVVLGAVVATLVGYASAMIVIQLTALLKK